MRNNNTRKNRFLALFLSVLMVSAAGTAFAACGDSSSESSSSSSSSATSTKKDDGLIKNAGFEIDDVSDTKPIITSVSSWTRSVNSETSGSALSSKTASGVIDTSAEKWNDLTKSNFEGEDFSTWTEEKAKSEWKNMSVKDKLAYYDAWEKNNKDDDKDVDDLEFYESFNIDSEDIPDCENPKTHYAEGAEGANENTNVLMIHNEYSNTTYDAFGTAQKYTSSTNVTVSAGTSAKFSVWVKTSNLSSSATNGDEQDVVDKGAYISITNSLGSNKFEPLEVKNINTEGVTTHNGWVQYQFYLKGASYVDSTFTIVLGLGKGGNTNRHEYVNGYAFFDDISCETITNDAFDTETANVNTKTVYHDDEKADKSFHAGEVSYDAYAIDFAKTSTSDAWTTKGAYVLDESWSIAPTTEERNGNVYTAVQNPANGVTTYQGLGVSTEGDVNGTFTKSTMAAVDNKFIKAVYNKNFKDSEFIGDNDKVLMLLSANGAAYTAQSQATKVTLAPETYAAVSFYAKTSEMSGFTGANATLLDGTNKTAISSIDTTTIATVDINDDTKDIYEGWVRYYFFVSNETDEAKDFTVQFGFGPTTVIDTTKSSYYTGFAAFTKFEYYTFADEKAFDSAANGSYAKVVSLTGSEEKATGDGGFDSAAAVPSNAIENGFANPKNYNGVYSDSDYVNGGGDGTKTELYTNANAGLLNKEHAANYTAILEKLGGTGATWDSVIGGDATQPLVIYNEGVQTLPYGFIGKSTTISPDSYATVSLRVKVSKGATASVYLVDMDDDTHESFLSVDRKHTYWYDDDGNVCAKDPTNAKDFNEKKDVAFKLQSNGLYKVNPSWEGATGIDANAYYANLSAYEKDEHNNLVVADGGVSYNYTDKWKNDGNDGIAFYYNESDQTYYADSAKTVAVKGLASVTALPTRFNAENGKDLKIQVTGDVNTPVWQTVTFYIHTGDVAKNYRLEVWNGDRETTVNESGSYVIFDSYSPDAVDGKFTTLIDQRVEEIDANETLGSYLESVFSFYDSAKYLRYDETADVNGVGNDYTSYLSSSNTEGVAFLQYDKGAEHEIYADYSYAEYTVTPDLDDDVADDDEETEETPSDINVWVLISSIAIAAVLVLAVISLIVRKIVARHRKKRGSGALARSMKSKK